MAEAVDILQKFKLSIRETETKGKGLFADAPIKEGDVILQELPLVSAQFSWNKTYNYTACEYCMKSLETAQNMARRLSNKYDLELPYVNECCDISKQRRDFVKCPRCQERYCCEVCFEKAEEQYHRVLCLGHKEREHPLRKIEEVWKQIHYPPETSTIMLIVKMIGMTTQSNHPKELLSQFNQFNSNIQDRTHKMAHKLLGEQFKEQLVTLHGLLQQVIKCMDLNNEIKSLENLQSLFGLIGMNGQGIGTSSLSKYVQNVDALLIPDEEREQVDAIIDNLYDDIANESGQFLNCEGSGLYSTQSRCNHSCQPNAEVTFPDNNSNMVLVAISDIQPGEEVCICYLDDCQRSRSRHSRRKVLRDNYLFECTCSRCELDENEISETSSEEDDVMDEDDE